MKVIKKFKTSDSSLDNQLYFLTAYTYYNNNDDHVLQKKKLLEKIKKDLKKYNFKLYAWVILDNRYYLMIKSSSGKFFTKIFGNIHANYTLEMNRLENKKGRKIWQNWSQFCIKEKKDFWLYFNYIHYNPIKHGYAKRMEDYEFSSYKYWLSKKGADWINSVVKKYPVNDISIPPEDK